MDDSKIVGYFNSFQTLRKVGEKKYLICLPSVQEIFIIYKYNHFTKSPGHTNEVQVQEKKKNNTNSGALCPSLLGVEVGG